MLTPHCLMYLMLLMCNRFNALYQIFQMYFKYSHLRTTLCWVQCCFYEKFISLAYPPIDIAIENSRMTGMLKWPVLETFEMDFILIRTCRYLNWRDRQFAFVCHVFYLLSSNMFEFNIWLMIAHCVHVLFFALPNQ